MIEDWIDEVAKTAGLVPAGNEKRVRSFQLFGRSEFPESLTTFPCALTFIEESGLEYQLGGGGRNFWKGFTEFHLTPDLNRKRYPEVLLYFKRIRDAFAGNMTLNGKVASFTLRAETSIQGPAELQYGGEKPHFGLVAYWQVKELENNIPTAMGNIP